MANKDGVELDGVVLESLPNTTFRVEVSHADQKRVLYATISGKMRTRYIRILPGDRVKVVVIPPDLTKGRITYRYR